MQRAAQSSVPMLSPYDVVATLVVVVMVVVDNRTCVALDS